MKTNTRRQTFEESGVAIRPYDSLPSIKNCKNHTPEISEDGAGRKFKRCSECWAIIGVVN